MKFQLSFLMGMVVAIAGAAEPQSVEQIMAFAVKDPKNAPLVIEYAVEDNPGQVLPIVTAGMKALPEQAVAIVAAGMKAVSKPKAEGLTEQQKLRQTEQQKEILRTAILTVPAIGAKLTEMALTLFPAKAAEFLQTAIAATPEANRAELVALANKLVSGSEPAGAASPASAAKQSNRPPRWKGKFPPQPVRPDPVSPSS